MKRLYCLVVLLGLVVLNIHAAPLDSLYQVDYPVPSQSPTDWQQALPQALTQVLVKVSGNEQIAQSPKVQAELKNAQTYVESYNYYSTTDAAGKSNLMLHIQFNAEALNQIISQTQTKAMAKQPAVTVLWLALQTPQGVTLVSNNNTDAFMSTLQDDAKNLNLTIMLPLLDLEDMNQVNVNDIVNLNPTNAIQASRRYGATNVVVGRIFPGVNNAGWQGDLVFTNNGDTQHWQLTADTQAQLIDKMMNNLSSMMAVKKAIVKAGDSKEVVSLRITNVNGLDDYAAIENYLHSLAPVANVEVANLEGQDIVVNVTATGGKNALLQSLNAGQKLVEDNTAVATDNVPTYRWAQSSNNATVATQTP